MNNRIENWHTEIDKTTKNFISNFGGLDLKQLNWKPNTKSWSIAQVVDHLLKTNESYFIIPDKMKSEDFKPSLLSKTNFFPKFFGKLILKGVDPNTKRKVKTGGVFEPAQSNLQPDIIEKFNSSQKQLHEFLDNNAEDIKNRKVIPSPLNKHIVYHFDTVIDIIVNHQKRHFNQAMRVLKNQS